MIKTYGDAINALAERTNENTQMLKRSKTQRRVSFVDLYGIPFTAQGDANTPATFYISASPDLAYYERFAFKFVIQPFTSSVSGLDAGSLSVGSTSLTYQLPQTEGQPGIITPNPHTHSLSGSIGGVSYGVTKTPTSSSVWRVVIHGVDITPYLMEQHEGEWIDGEGIFPTNSLENEEDFYDILDVACMLEAEGRTEDRNKLLMPEFKKVQIYSDAPFSVTAYLYQKYSNVNR